MDHDHLASTTREAGGEEEEARGKRQEGRRRTQSRTCVISTESG
jgi:hypothetical protein